MVVEIKSVEIGNEEIVMEATNLEKMLCSDDLYEEIDEETVRFVFPREHGASSLKYLYKVCEGTRRCKNAKSLGEKIEKLVGQIISLSENFIER